MSCNYNNPCNNECTIVENYTINNYYTSDDISEHETGTFMIGVNGKMASGSDSGSFASDSSTVPKGEFGPATYDNIYPNTYAWCSNPKDTTTFFVSANTSDGTLLFDKFDNMVKDNPYYIQGASLVVYGRSLISGDLAKDIKFRSEYRIVDTHFIEASDPTYRINVISEDLTSDSPFII